MKSLVIRTYDMFGVVSAELEKVRATTGRILTAVPLYVMWRDCSGRGSDGDAPECSEPLANDEVILRLAAAPGVIAPYVLGESLVDTRARKGVLATVYADRVRSLADRAGVERGQLLGWAVAHEIGHLLLGTPGHAPVGLMRANWSEAELQGNIGADWMWSRREIAAIVRNLVRTRTETARLAKIAANPATIPQSQ